MVEALCITGVIAYITIPVLVCWDPLDWIGLRKLDRRMRDGSYNSYHHLDLREYYNRQSK